MLSSAQHDADVEEEQRQQRLHDLQLLQQRREFEQELMAKRKVSEMNE